MIEDQRTNNQNRCPVYCPLIKLNRSHDIDAFDDHDFHLLEQNADNTYSCKKCHFKIHICEQMKTFRQYEHKNRFNQFIRRDCVGTWAYWWVDDYGSKRSDFIININYCLYCGVNFEQDDLICSIDFEEGGAD